MFSGIHDRSMRVCQWSDPEVFGSIVTAQWPWEIMIASVMVQEIKPKLLVEIGSQNGGSLVRWMTAAPDDCTIVAIDPAPEIDWLKGDPRLRVFETRTDDPATIAAVKELGPIDFLFIDGDHHYNGALYDFETYGPMVRKTGGLIVFHDISTQFRDDCQVWRLWQEIRAAGYLTREILAAHPTPWGGIGIVYME